MSMKNIKLKISLFLVLTLLFWLVGSAFIYASDDDEQLVMESSTNISEISDDNGDSIGESGEEGAGLIDSVSGIIYIIKSFIEELRVSFIEDRLEKSKAYLELADKKMEEVNSYLNQNANENNNRYRYRCRYAERALNLYQKYIIKANEILEEVANDDGEGGKTKGEVSQLVAEATSKHLDVLQKVYEKVPEQAKDAILKAMEVSKKGNEAALNAINKSTIPGENDEKEAGGDEEIEEEKQDEDFEEEDLNEDNEEEIEEDTNEVEEDISMEVNDVSNKGNQNKSINATGNNKNVNKNKK